MFIPYCTLLLLLLIVNKPTVNALCMRKMNMISKLSLGVIRLNLDLDVLLLEINESIFKTYHSAMIG